MKNRTLRLIKSSALGLASVLFFASGIFASAPTAPSDLSLVSNFGSRVTIEWTDNSSTETGFRIYRSTDGVNFQRHAIVARDRNTYSDRRLISGRSYHYRATAYNGSGESAPSNSLEVEVGGGGAPPLAPTSLVATAQSTTQIDLSWTDNSSDETSFRIEQSTNGVNFSEIDSVAADSTGYSVTGLSPSTLYWFRVRARNLSGSSSYSNLASATTNSDAGGPTLGSVFVAGSNLGSPFSLRKFNSDASSLIWGADHGALIYGMAIDSSNNIYIAGNTVGGVSLRKFDSSGNLLWSADAGSPRAVAVDSSGNVYVAGDRTGGITTRKFDSAGNLLWSLDSESNLRAIAVDTSGNVYTAGTRVSNLTTRVYNTSGSPLWSADHGATVLAIDVDSSGNVYTGGVGDPINEYNLQKFDLSGSFVWGHVTDPGEFTTVNALLVDSSDNVYIATDGGFLTNQIFKLNSSASILWSAPYNNGINGVQTICFDLAGDIIATQAGNEVDSLGKFSATDGSLVFSRPRKSFSFAAYRSCAVDSAGNIYVAGERFGEFDTLALDSDGEIVLELDTSDNGEANSVFAVAADAEGNIYVGRGGTDTTQKIDASGELVWAVSHGASVTAIAVDGDRNVYTGGVRTGNLTTRKYDSSGTLLWSRDHGSSVSAIAVDSSGNVYTGGARIGNLTTRKYDSSGTLLWSRDHGSTVNAIAVDASGNVYTAGNRTSNLTTRKYAADGTLLWSRDHGANARAIDVDASGNVYAGGNFISSVTHRKYDSSGNLLWSGNHGNTVNGLKVDSNGDLYVAGVLSSGFGGRKFDSDGNLLFSFAPGNALFGIAVPVP